MKSEKDEQMINTMAESGIWVIYSVIQKWLNVQYYKHKHNSATKENKQPSKTVVSKKQHSMTINTVQCNWLTADDN